MEQNKNIKDLLEAFIRRSSFKSQLDAERISKTWYALFDKNIAGFTQSLSFKEGILYVRLHSAPLREELSRNKKSIIQHINEALAEPLVEDIRFL